MADDSIFSEDAKAEVDPQESVEEYAETGAGPGEVETQDEKEESNEEFVQWGNKGS